MFIKKCVVIFISLFCCNFQLLAESKNGRQTDFRQAHSDFFHLFFSERTDVRAGYLEEWDVKEVNGKSSFDSKDYFFDSLFQAQISRDSFYSLGLNFNLRQYEFDTPIFSEVLESEENLYKFAFSPGFGTFLNDDFLFWTQVSLGSYSDFETNFGEIKNYQVLGSSQLIYRINPGAQLLLGLKYSNDYLETKLLPFLGIRLLSDTGAFQLTMDLPFNARAGYYITPYIETFAKLDVRGDRYRVSMSDQTFNVGIHDERAGGGLRFWLGNNFSLTFEGGRTLGNQLKFYLPYPSEYFGGDLNSHWYAQAYLGIAF